jgi:hypothetical protein
MLVDEGKLLALATVTAVGFRIGVFSNTYTVVRTTTLGDLTPAAGFQNQSLVFPTNPVLNGLFQGSSTWNPTTHTNSGIATQVLRGWYIVDAAFGRLWAAGNFPVPITVPVGDSTIINPASYDDTL